MIAAQRLYFPLLKLTFLAIVLALGRAVFAPNLGKIPAYTFPGQVPLTEAKFVGSQAALTPSWLNEEGKEISGYQYQYQQNDRTFEIKSYYIQDFNGDLLTYVKTYVSDNKAPNAWAHKQDNNGAYTLFEYQQTAYLSACINPKGSSTATPAEFFANRNQYDLQVNRLIPVLIGREEPRDTRCLWVTISTPLQNQAVEAAHQQLEAVWQQWYAWWAVRFPSL